MSEENKNAEVVKEINPVEEYLNRYKEQRLAEFCVQKDKEIASYKKGRQELVEQLADMRHKVEKYDKAFESVEELYIEIKKMPVDNYLKLYHMISNDVSGYGNLKTTISSSGFKYAY